VKRGSLRSVLLALVMACIVPVSMAPPALADTPPGGKAPRADPTRLWSTFPLNPPELPVRQVRPARRSVPARAQSSAEVLSAERSWFLTLIIVVASASLAALAVRAIWSAASAPQARLQWPALGRFASTLARHRVSIIVIVFGFSALAALEWLVISHLSP
jgi:hypothetical protein